MEYSIEMHQENLEEHMDVLPILINKMIRKIIQFKFILVLKNMHYRTIIT
jgi:hypothetical protein